LNAATTVRLSRPAHWEIASCPTAVIPSDYSVFRETITMMYDLWIAWYKDNS